MQRLRLVLLYEAVDELAPHIVAVGAEEGTFEKFVAAPCYVVAAVQIRIFEGCGEGQKGAEGVVDGGFGVAGGGDYIV